MLGKQIRLFRILGFNVRVDLSWTILAVLITWTLAAGYFPRTYPELSPASYWVMGALGALGLFVSIVFHELCHSLVAGRFGMQMEGITLFIFGGVAEMHQEPPNAKAEFLMAAAGPAASLVFAIFCLLVTRLGALLSFPVVALGVLAWLAMINIILVIFNLVPGFPLDGGRILRSALWAWKKDLRWATHVAAKIGAYFGLSLIILGIFDVFLGNPIGGIWLVLIGWFLRRTSDQSYQQLLLRQSLEGEPVRRFMSDQPVTVSPDLPVNELVEQYIYRTHHKFYPVAKDGHLLGCVTLQQVRETPRELWGSRTVGEIARPCGQENTAAATEDAMAVLSRMNENKVSRMMVVSGDRLEGIVSLKDLLSFFSMKMDLEGNGQARRPAV